MASSENYFDLFQVPSSFSIDLKQLKEKFKALQIEYHPDQHVSANDEDKLRAMQASARINDGFQVLKSPSRRAKHIANLAGLDLEKDRRIDPGILMEQMELRDSLDAMRQDQRVELEKIEGFADEVDKKILDAEKSFQTISSLFFEKAEKFSLEEMKQNLSLLLFLYKLKQDTEEVCELKEFGS